MGTITVGIIVGIALAIFFVVLTIWSRAQAKRDAKEILAIGKIENARKFKDTMDILARVTNDLEAADLWKKLQALNEQSIT